MGLREYRRKRDFRVSPEPAGRVRGRRTKRIFVVQHHFASRDEVSGFARALAYGMARENPRRYIATASRAARKGLIFLDWLRNTRGATAVAAWSTRARPAPRSPSPWNGKRSTSSGVGIGTRWATCWS